MTRKSAFCLLVSLLISSTITSTVLADDDLYKELHFRVNSNIVTFTLTPTATGD